MSAIGTSQESARPETLRQLAIMNKSCGVDLQHIGDAGYGGLAPAENISKPRLQLEECDIPSTALAARSIANKIK